MSKIHHFTDEQKSFIAANVKGITSNELTERFNIEFGTDLPPRKIRAFMKNHGLKNGVKGQFQKGQTAWNKGMKGLDLAGENGRKTQFKKGQEPTNYRPVGSERIDNKDGYVMVKVSDHGTQFDRWKLKQRVIWEKANGPLPENHVIIFVDGDKYNFDLGNLVSVDRNQLLQLNRRGYLNGDPDLLKVGLNLISLDKKIIDFEVKGGDLEAFKKYEAAAEKNGISKGTFWARLKRGWSMQDAIYKPLHARREAK